MRIYYPLSVSVYTCHIGNESKNGNERNQFDFMALCKESKIKFGHTQAERQSGEKNKLINQSVQSKSSVLVVKLICIERNE